MIFRVNVKPNSSREVIKRISDVEFNIHVKEPPRDGKANLKVIKLIAKKFGVSSREVIIKNPSSRKKIIEIKKS